MPKEVELFLKEELTFSEKFYKLMDVLISEQHDCLEEAIFFKGFNYLQTLSLFFSEQIGVFDPKNCKSDFILNKIEIIVRIKNLFRNNYKGLEILVYLLFLFIIIFILFFIFDCIKTNYDSVYTYNKKILNILIKIFLYLLFNIILDICFANFCFGFDENNPNFDQVIKCRGEDTIIIKFFSGIFILLAFLLHIFFQIFKTDLFFFSNSCYAKMSCNYDIYMDINCLINSILVTQIIFLKKETFLLYNTIFSIIMFLYYLKYYCFYDSTINCLTGTFHSLYMWTCLFCLLFSFLDFKEKGIIYILSCIIVYFCYLTFKTKFENNILINKPPSKLKNLNHLLFFFKNFSNKIIEYEKSSENKAFISGILQVLLEERPNEKSTQLINGELYMPITNKWRDLKKDKVEDEVFRKYFIVIMINYFIYYYEYCPELYFNLSLYFLILIQNYCQAMHYFQKISTFKLNITEHFTYMRLKFKITDTLLQNLKPSDEENVYLKHVNVSMYYKYDTLSHNFIEEINNDVELSLEFWKSYKRYFKDSNIKINFNKIFKLTDKIQTKKKIIEKMWKDLLKIYNGVNEYFEFYSEYIEQINDDDLKIRDYLKRKKENLNDHLSYNYYSKLFHKDTGIIIAEGDIGSEGIIRHCNKRIEGIFKYKISDLKGINVNKLMPKLFEKEHNKYIERYFRLGAKKYIENSDFKTFAKDKNNSIFHSELALKLLPILNSNVFFVCLIVKESINDIILLDKDFIIQGMSDKLMKILNIDNNYLFQDNNIPFYVICKKFINFFNIFLNNKNSVHQELEKKTTTFIFDDKNTIKEIEEKETNKKRGSQKPNQDEKHDIEINENAELEYEIKIPLFLINYSEKTKPEMNRNCLINEIVEKLEYENDINDNNHFESSDDESEDDNESGFLINERGNKNEMSSIRVKSTILHKALNTPEITPTPGTPGNSPFPGAGLKSMTFSDNLNNRILNEQNRKCLKSEEVRTYFERISQYQKLFNEEKFNELEDLIDLCNKNSPSSEYKFNFTFDKNKFGDNEILYMIRCIDNKLQEGESDDKSIGDMDPKALKYKKEKEDAIKPLYEIFDYEKEEIIKMPELFLKLSLENKKFQELLESCKNEIIIMSKNHGGKKTEILEDENSSQTSQAGFNNDLVKKNRIEEIKANLFKSVTNFYTLKYIRMTVTLIMLCTLAFSIIYLVYILGLNSNLKSVSIVNLYLFQTTLWTTELVSIFISLKVLLLNQFGRINIDFMNFQSFNIQNNLDYFNEMEKLGNILYNNLSLYYSKIEMEIPKYLTETQLLSLYWDHINISYFNNKYEREGWIQNQSFPTAIDQFLCNGKEFLKYGNLYETINSKIDDLEFEELFNYRSHLIIENAYNNIIPNQFKKLSEIPEVFSKFNIGKRKVVLEMILFFLTIITLLCIIYYIMIRATNISMTIGFQKITKIKIDKIEEIIKKIEIFNYNIKKFRNKESNNIEDSFINGEIKEEENPKNYITSKKYSNSLDNIKNEKRDSNKNLSLLGNGEFLSDSKRYIPITILEEYFYHGIILIIFLSTFLILIYIFSITMIQNINQLLIIEKFIYGKLISISAEISEVKYFIIGAKNTTILDYSELKSNSEIRDMIKGLKNFKEINDYYNNKYLLDACQASIDKNLEPEKFEYCYKNDTIISTSNNTDNLIKLIDNIIDNIYKKDEMEIYSNQNDSTQSNISDRLYLFNESNFKNIEYIYYNYIFSVGDFYSKSILMNLDYYLMDKKRVLLILVCSSSIIIIIYCIIFLSIYIPRLIKFLNISRSVLKIIPTSIIMITPELENWIQSKY